MEITFACGTTLDRRELNNYSFFFCPEDIDGYDEDIGSPDQEFWDVNVDTSGEWEICFRQSDGHSTYLEENGDVYIDRCDLHVLCPRVVNKPLPLEKQKVLAKATLDKLRLASPKAVVAGGAAAGSKS